MRENNSVVETVPNGRKKLDEIKQRVVIEQFSSFTYKKIDNSGDASVTLSKSETMVSSDDLIDFEGSVTLVY